MGRSGSVDLSEFDQSLTPRERKDLISQRFPSVNNLDWSVALQDEDLFGRLLRDIVKVDLAVPGKSGPRFGLTRQTGEPALARLVGKDPMAGAYTMLPFSEALRHLMGKRSLRGMEAKLGGAISRSRIHKLLKGETPRVEEIEVIARVFGKLPGFFLEYRVHFVASAVAMNLTARPDASIAAYEKVWSKNAKG